VTSRASSVAGFPGDAAVLLSLAVQRQFSCPLTWPNGKSPARRCAPRGDHISGTVSQLRRRPCRAAHRANQEPWRTGEQPNPPTRRLARWEVVLRLHARYVAAPDWSMTYTIAAPERAVVFPGATDRLLPKSPRHSTSIAPPGARSASIAPPGARPASTAPPQGAPPGTAPDLTSSRARTPQGTRCGRLLLLSHDGGCLRTSGACALALQLDLAASRPIPG
jgi:hypothetical protein